MLKKKHQVFDRITFQPAESLNNCSNFFLGFLSPQKILHLKDKGFLKKTQNDNFLTINLTMLFSVEKVNTNSDH